MDLKLPSSTVVTVNWEHPEYSVTEGDIFEVCAIVQESTARQFTVNIAPTQNEGDENIKYYYHL